MHRARSGIRSKPVTQAVRASGRSTWQVDETATGSVNFFGPGAVVARALAEARAILIPTGVRGAACQVGGAVLQEEFSSYLT